MSSLDTLGAIFLQNKEAKSVRFRRRFERDAYIVCIPVSDKVGRNGAEELRKHLAILASCFFPEHVGFVGDGVGHKAVFARVRVVPVGVRSGAHEGGYLRVATGAGLRGNKAKML